MCQSIVWGTIATMRGRKGERTGCASANVAERDLGELMNVPGGGGWYVGWSSSIIFIIL